MAINLTKGQTISLSKETNDLSQVTIGLGWDVVQKNQGGFLSRLTTKKEEEDYDLDAIAFLMDKQGKVNNLGAMDGNQMTLKGSDVVFFNSMHHPSGAIWLTGDNRTGAGDGDDEQIIVQLDRIPAEFDRILFVVCIYQGRQKGQHFGGVENAFIRAVDARNQEIARFNLSRSAETNNMCSLEFAELYRKDGGWKFRALGVPFPSDSFVELLKKYV